MCTVIEVLFVCDPELSGMPGSQEASATTCSMPDHGQDSEQ